MAPAIAEVSQAPFAWMSIFALINVIGFALILFYQTHLRRIFDRQRVQESIQNFTQTQERLERLIRDEATASRNETSQNLRSQREEVNVSFHASMKTLSEAIYGIRESIDQRFIDLQQTHQHHMETIRKTVDEHLLGSLDQRLGQAYRSVAERLEQVQRGLGEMQTLANGVGDLKKMLSNARARGAWGEVQLAAILEQMLTREQYDVNVAIRKNSPERVEFAVRLPGTEIGDHPVYLPIDSKFPLDSYLRLLQAQDDGNVEAMESHGQELELRVKSSAKDIRDKYIHPPHSTDFAIMFLPTEGLYAEVLRRPGLAEFLQNQYRVSLAGPTTLAALLNSLQMGFRTLAIQKRSSEVWKVLGVVKTQFGQFSTLLEKVQKKLQEASHVIDDATSKSRTLERKLAQAETAPGLPTSQQNENS